MRSISIRKLLKGTFVQFQKGNLGDWSAALTYYALFSLFPGLIALVSIVGLVGNPDTVTSFLTDTVESIGPPSAVETLKGPIESVTKNRTSAGFLLLFGLLGALWSASAYIGAFARAANTIYNVKENRSFAKLRPLQMAMTLVLVVAWSLVLLALVLTGPVAYKIGAAAGVEESAVDVWNLAKWPVLLIAIMLIISLLYYSSPNIEFPGFKSVIPGSIFAVTIWLISSVAFSFYISNFGSYNRTYGTLGGVIVLLLWLWISNSAILLGASFNSAKINAKK